MWHHAVSQCRGIEDVETGKKHCVDPTARYPSKIYFDHLTKSHYFEDKKSKDTYIDTGPSQNCSGIFLPSRDISTIECH